MFLFIIYGSGITGQQKNDSTVYKNEIGVNLSPAIKVLAGSWYKGYFDNSFFYKRRCNNKLWWRLSGGIIFDKRRDVYSAPNIKDKDSLSVSIDYWETRMQPTYHLESGLEYRWNKKALTHFAGIDIGYSRSEYKTSNYYGTRSKYDYINVRFFNFEPSQYNPDSLITSFKRITDSFVILPFIGLQTRFSKRYCFSIQLGIPLIFENITYRDIVSNSPDQYYRYYKYKHFDITQILNNFSLCYRF